MRDINCPKCLSLEIDSDGVCLVCGYRMDPVDRPEEDAGAAAASPDMHVVWEDAADPIHPDSEPSSELPEWRVELSRRLQEIKSKREGGGGGPSAELIKPAGDIAKSLWQKREAEPAAPKPVSPKRGARKPRSAPVTLNLNLEPHPDSPVEPSPEPGQEQAAAPIAEPDVAAPPPDTSTLLPAEDGSESDASPEAEIQQLIDSVTARRADLEAATKPGAERAPLFSAPPQTDKLILMTRFLSGLVDFVIVLVCASSFIFAVDVLEGIDVFDTVSLIHSIVLLLAVYFVYSIFFLSTGGQTIGMMLTDLRIDTGSAARPRLSQIILRCGSYLLGIAALGAGLLWGCFDRQSRCLHDHVSHTRIVRVAVE